MTALTQNGQLSFDFNVALKKENAPRKKGSFNYHPKDSNILKDVFSIKVTYNGRTYILKGRYRIATVRAFGDLEDKMHTLGFVEINKVLAYKGFMYSIAIITQKQKANLTKIVKNILANPSFNENLSV